MNLFTENVHPGMNVFCETEYYIRVILHNEQHATSRERQHQKYLRNSLSTWSTAQCLCLVRTQETVLPGMNVVRNIEIEIITSNK